MGYTATIFLASIFFSPLVLFIGAIVWLVALRTRLIPSGISGIVGYALLACFGFGALYLYVTLDLLVIKPARLQQQYVGQIYGNPFDLRRFEQSGFQDPASEWRYALTPATAAALRKRCKRNGARTGYAGCVLYSETDDRWFAEVSLSGNELRMTDGLW